MSGLGRRVFSSSWPIPDDRRYDIMPPQPFTGTLEGPGHFYPSHKFNLTPALRIWTIPHTAQTTQGKELKRAGRSYESYLGSFFPCSTARSVPSRSKGRALARETKTVLE